MTISPLPCLRRLWLPLAASVTLSAPSGAQTYFIDHFDHMSNAFRRFSATMADATGDFNNDGWPDLFRARANSSQYQLLEHQGELHFVDRTDLILGRLSDKWRGSGAQFADYDNDGDLDLFVPTGRWKVAEAGFNTLLRNDRGVFTDVTLQDHGRSGPRLADRHLRQLPRLRRHRQ